MPEILHRFADHTQVDMVWPHVQHLLSPAYKYSDGKWDEESVYELLKSNHALLWFSGTEDKLLSAAITKIDKFPGGAKRLTIFAAGGDKAVLRLGYPYVEDYARWAGCDGIEINGRDGWVREFRDLGFRKTSTTVRKRLK